MTLTKYEGSTFPVPIGEYMDWIHGQEAKQTYALQCPKCFRAFCLANHTVTDGVVSPSVVCPFDCGFHEHLELR
jgi:hypothetical protein